MPADTGVSVGSKTAVITGPFGLGRVAGKGEEHFVERRMPERDVVDNDSRVVESTHRERRGCSVPPSTGSESRRVGRVECGFVGAESTPTRPRATSSVYSSGACNSITGRPACAFRSLAVPSAMTLPLSTITMRAGKVIGFVEILRREQHVGAVRRELTNRIPQLDATARIERGRRFVEEQETRRPDEARAEIQAPALPTGVRAHEPIADLGEAQPLEHVAGAPLGRCRRDWPYSSATIVRFSRPVIAASTAACWPARPMTCRTRSASRPTSNPATRTVPASGRSSVATVRTNVVLPGAVGAEHGYDLARLHRQVEAGQRLDLAEVLPHSRGFHDCSHDSSSRPHAGPMDR